MLFDIKSVKPFNEEAESGRIPLNVAEMLNNQVAAEFYSAYLYLAIANYYNYAGLHGFQRYFDIQAREEMMHGMKIRKYLLDNNIPVTLPTINHPDKEFSNALAPLDAALEHEKKVTGMINDIYKAASEANDYKTTQFLDWFVNEQIEEEKSASDLCLRAARFTDNGKGSGMRGLDEELSKR